MVSIFATSEILPDVQNCIAQEDRLDELVAVLDLLEHRPGFSGMNLIVRPKQGIVHPIDWENTWPPYLMPEETSFSCDHLLGFVFAKLGNWAQSQRYLAHNRALWCELEMVARLQSGQPANPTDLHSDFHPFEEYRFCHNSAILHHYAATEASFDPNKTAYFYEEALKAAPNEEYAAFTAKHYAAFLTDWEDLGRAERVLRQHLPLVLSEEAGIALKTGLCQVWMKQLRVPYDPALLEALKNTLWEVMQYYKQHGRPVEEGLALIDAAQIAHYSNSFAEALGYINRAVDIFRAEEISELFAQAHHRRAMLLYTWAKNDNPQFFKGALDSFKEALKVFSRTEAPETFADIQQYLGIIYAEMPDEDLKRGVWAAISSSAFQEALSFYKKERYPYEHAMVCNHYGNALTKYPSAVHSDNIEKALFYYNEALQIRQADSFPLERATTLLNYVEASWHLNLAGNGSNHALFEDMIAKATEASSLTDDSNIREAAAAHLEKLEALRVVLAQEAH